MSDHARLHDHDHAQDQPRVEPRGRAHVTDPLPSRPEGPPVTILFEEAVTPTFGRELAEEARRETERLRAQRLQAQRALPEVPGSTGPGGPSAPGGAGEVGGVGEVQPQPGTHWFKADRDGTTVAEVFAAAGMGAADPAAIPAHYLDPTVQTPGLRDGAGVGPGVGPGVAAAEEPASRMTLVEIAPLYSRGAWAMIWGGGFAISMLAYSSVPGLGDFGLAWALLAWVLPALAAIDLKTMKLPDVIVYPTGATVAVLALTCLAVGDLPLRNLIYGLVSAAACGLYYLVASFFGLGFGDVKLVSVAAFVLGTYSPVLAAVGLLVAPPLLMLPVALALLALRGTRTYPFGPAIAIAALGAMTLPFFAPGALSL